MTIRNTIYLFLALAIAGCTSSKHKNTNSIQCTNLDLLLADSSVPTIEIDFVAVQDTFYEYLASKLKQDTKHRQAFFNLRLSDSSSLMVNTNSTIVCGVVKRTYLAINTEGLIQFEGTIKSLDSLEYVLNKQIEEQGYQMGEIGVRWDKRLSNTGIDSVFLGIQSAYKRTYQNMAEDIFQTPLCDLNTLELDSIKKRLPLVITIESYRRYLDLSNRSISQNL